MGVGGHRQAPVAVPLGQPVPIVQRFGGPHGLSGEVRKSRPSPGFDPQTVQPVASSYID